MFGSRTTLYTVEVYCYGTPWQASESGHNLHRNVLCVRELHGTVTLLSADRAIIAMYAPGTWSFLRETAES